MAYNDSYYGDMSADGGFSLFDLLTGNADGYQTTPAVTESYAPTADYGMGVQTRPNIIHELMPYTEPVRNIPTADYGMGVLTTPDVIRELLPYTEPVQSTPAVTTEQVPMDSVLPSVAYTDSGAPIATNPNMSEADFLASLTGQPAAAPAASGSSDYYTALRDYVAGLSSPYGTYTPEVSQLLRSTAGSPTGRLGSGAYDVMASNPYAALANPDAPIDPGILAAITSAVNPNAPYEQNVTYQFNPFSEGKYASSNAIDVLYNTPIRLTDAQGNTIMSGVGFQAAEQIAKAVQDAYGSGTKSEFRIDTGMPGDTTGDTFKTASIVSPEQNGLKLFATLAALATLGSGLIAPAGAGAGAGAGAAGTTAAGTGAAAAGTGAAAAGTGVGAGTLAALAPVAGEIVVPGIVGGGLGAAGAAGLGAAAATGLALAQSGALSPATAAAQAPATPEPTAPAPIEVVGAPTSSMADIAAYLGVPAITAPVVARPLTPVAPEPQPAVTEPTAPEPTAPEPITVTAPTTPLVPTETLLPIAAAPVVAPSTPAPEPIAPEPIAPEPITVTAPTTPVIPPEALLPAVAAPVVASPTAVPEPEPITVTAPTTTPTSIAPEVLAGLITAAPVAAVTTAGAGATPTTTTPEKTPSLLDQIIKYYSLASLAGGALGDLFGNKSGTAGTTTPYTSVLGPTPTFGRGTFQPYTGNYETYGQGPEWNFFTPTTQTYTPLI